MDKTIEYFAGDELAASVFKGKYALPEEDVPSQMHLRMALEFARIEQKRNSNVYSLEGLTEFGRNLQIKLSKFNIDGITNFVYSYLDGFKNIVPQGSIMSALGNKYKIQSLSNCFVIPAPYDSYGGIFNTDQEIAQLEKRRGGVGTNLDTLRPEDTPVNNAAGTSTGGHSFMSRYSNTTREVAQNGRRGALMLLMSCLHPDIFKFVTKKKDRTQITGANVSVMITDEFMNAALLNEDFLCRFPTNAIINDEIDISNLEYNKLKTFDSGKSEKIQIMKIKAKELLDLIIEMAHENAEPGVAFMDRVRNYCPEGVYPQFVPIASNPCGEQWMQAYDACRLLAANLYNMVVNHFSQKAKIDYDKVYEVFYIQQRLADAIVDLEIEYVQRIIDKIKKDDEPKHIKSSELRLWENIKQTATDSRRTGCGFTALGDMLAALSIKYDSDESIKVIEELMKVKLSAELDATTDLSILFGRFNGWDKDKEFEVNEGGEIIGGRNQFFQMIYEEFPNQARRMYRYGRRNVSWSTVAPTGSVSILTQTSSGLEPVFMLWYMRRKKINPSDKESRVDFVDKNGDSWQEFPVLHPKFKDWININFDILGLSGQQDIEEEMSKENLQKAFEKSPWYGSTANDISWEKRIDIQSIIQKYTTNAISSTINLPRDVSVETVSGIYTYAWQKGLKGVTIYRDGSRDGVLISSESKTESTEFKQYDAVKRPKELNGKMYDVRVKGELYNIIIGILDEKPYEIFVMRNHDTRKVEDVRIVKAAKGKYNILYSIKGEEMSEINIASDMSNEEAVITRLISSALRHGTNVKFLVEQLNKTNGDMTSFSKAIARTLKHFIPEGAKSTISCNECGSNTVIFEEGCSKCVSCGSSKCG